MRLLRLAEYQSRAFPPLNRRTAEMLAATGAVRVAADLDGRTVLTASSRVGILRCGDIQLRITPKFPVRRLLWLLGYAHNPRGWREDDIIDLAETDDFVTALAMSFYAATRRALTRGVLQGYHAIEETLPVLKGRLREVDQIRRRGGLALPVEVRYDDYTIDIPENRILLTAALRLLRIPGLPAATCRGIRTLAALLTGVTPLPVGDAVPCPPPNRMNDRYQGALRLARIVLAGHGIDHAPGTASAVGFLFDLDTVFEQWLTAVLRHSLPADLGRLRDQPVYHLDTDERVRIRPDLVWERHGRPNAVLDAKYKHTTHSNAPHADLYQMLAYCTALRLDEGHLVYASGTGPSTHTIPGGGTRIHLWALDLALPRRELLADIHALAVRITNAQ
ncbi:McrC family protein [Actinoalloteichus sp. GBA129-24]|uniref:McrC family protein n=1 Tax=Actinoalloteichus sp. GBA129-24 TaxID=1612551 RepID=UPI0009507EE9|nr:hypothetical protein [Actinoalloteichus sp. GBA129-24]APU21273.1 McrBC 5-methylcytosine restriction system component [Actinoalloteichus sp. GBA129-24]